MLRKEKRKRKSEDIKLKRENKKNEWTKKRKNKKTCLIVLVKSIDSTDMHHCLF